MKADQVAKIKKLLKKLLTVKLLSDILNELPLMRATQKKPARQEHFERSEEHSQSYSDNQIEMQP